MPAEIGSRPWTLDTRLIARIHHEGTEVTKEENYKNARLNRRQPALAGKLGAEGKARSGAEVHHELHE